MGVQVKADQAQAYSNAPMLGFVVVVPRIFLSKSVAGAPVTVPAPTQGEPVIRCSSSAAKFTNLGLALMLLLAPVSMLTFAISLMYVPTSSAYSTGAPVGSRSLFSSTRGSALIAASEKSKRVVRHTPPRRMLLRTIPLLVVGGLLPLPGPTPHSMPTLLHKPALPPPSMVFEWMSISFGPSALYTRTPMLSGDSMRLTAQLPPLMTLFCRRAKLSSASTPAA